MTSSFSFPFSSSFGSGFSFDPGGGGTSLDLLNPSPTGGLAGLSDMLIDPATGDYIQTDNGEWAETGDSRTIVMLMLDLELGASPFDPGDGTRLAALRRTGDPVTPEHVRSETLRAMAILANSGIVSDVTCQVRDGQGRPLRDQGEAQVAVTTWRDLASGTFLTQLIQG